MSKSSNQNTKLHPEFINLWNNTLVVKLITHLMFKFNKESIFQFENSITQKALTIDESICCESFFKRQPNRLLSNNHMNNNELCDCGIKMNYLYLKRYEKFNSLQEKTNKSRVKNTARSNYLVRSDFLLVFCCFYYYYYYQLLLLLLLSIIITIIINYYYYYYQLLLLLLSIIITIIIHY
jgi:hypothetical protein